MVQLPDCLFVVDVRKEELAVKEAHKLGIPVVAVVDTNCNPDNVDYIIPGNDDAIRAVRLFCSKIVDAIIEGAESWQLQNAEDGDDLVAAMTAESEEGAAEAVEAAAETETEAAATEAESADKAAAA
jgi:small subunit ribosomal protein S2